MKKTVRKIAAVCLAAVCVLFSLSGQTGKIARAEENAQVTYRSHVQNVGWQDWVSNGELSGTSGESLRMEAMNIQVESSYSGGISYRAHVQNVGWQSWVSDGALTGTSGQSLRMEAVQIKLTGEIAEHYDIYYQVHAQNIGWLGWAKNGESAGTEGYSFRLEAIRIQLVEKGSGAPGSTNNAFYKLSVNYRTHIQNIGWQSWVSNGATAGTSGQSLRMEALNISLDSFSGGITYRAHVQNVGWQSWVSDGALAGTSGQSLRMEAVQIRLTGTMASLFDVYYRVHAQNFGWMGWAKNGESAGTEGYSYRLEALQIMLVPKGDAAPGSTANAYSKYVAPSLPATQAYGWNSSWTYAGNSKIHSGTSTLYRATSNRKNYVVAINAGHGTSGGTGVKTLCHPDGSAKVTGGSTSAGSTYATAVAAGTTLTDGTSEATATLQLAQTIRDTLLANGFDVLMIRDGSDVQLDNVARTVMANNLANCHISLHYDSTSTNKGAFYISVPNVSSYRNMEPVKSHWQQHHALGNALISGLRNAGISIYSSGSMAIDLTQTSYSTIPSVDLEVGDRASDHSASTRQKIANGVLAGVKAYSGK